MGAALCALFDIINSDARSFKNMTASFVGILKQVAEHRLPKLYEYHRTPAPFVQVRHLRPLLGPEVVLQCCSVCTEASSKPDLRCRLGSRPFSTSSLSLLSKKECVITFLLFLQIKLLKILALLGNGDKNTSENMYSVLGDVLKQSDPSQNIGNAILYECICTITAIHPHAKLLEQAAEITSRFLKVRSQTLSANVSSNFDVESTDEAFVCFLWPE